MVGKGDDPAQVNLQPPLLRLVGSWDDLLPPPPRRRRMMVADR